MFIKLLVLIALTGSGVSVAGPANDSAIKPGENGKTLLNNISPKKLGTGTATQGYAWQGYEKLNGKSISVAITLQGRDFNLYADSKSDRKGQDECASSGGMWYRCKDTYTCDARARVVNNAPQVYVCAIDTTPSLPSGNLFDDNSGCTWRYGEHLTNRVCSVDVSPSGISLTFGSSTQSKPWN